jgi:hypothetical protein
VPFAQGHEQVEIPDNLELLFRRRFSQIVKSKTKSKFRALQAAIFDSCKKKAGANQVFCESQVGEKAEK